MAGGGEGDEILKWLSLTALERTYRDPVALAILAVDLFPILAVLQFGWDASALVFLYWLENIVIGGVTLLRMTASSVSNGIRGGTAMLAFGPFFIFHYGMFCFVHGIFLTVFQNMSQGTEPDFFSPVGLVQFALSTGLHMTLFVGVIIALQLFLFVRDFIGRGQWRETDPITEMGKPYGRIVVLHVGLFVGFGVMIALGQPFIGILGLIGLRALYGIYQTVRRRLQLEGEPTIKVDEVSLI